MKLVYTRQAVERLSEILEYLKREAGNDKAFEVRRYLLRKADRLLENPEMGQIEPYLTHLHLSHRRIFANHYKIVCRIDREMIYITDIFDTHQDPKQMKG